MKKGVFVYLLVFLQIIVLGQDIKVNLSHPNIALNEAFTITLTLNNDQIRSYGGFPEIQSFQKRGVSSQSSTNIINGQISFSQSYTQNYVPTKEGKFKLPNFNIEVNGKTIQIAGTVISVGPAKQQQQQQDAFGNDPFGDFFGRGGGKKEFIDVKEEAFFALNTNKDKVYIGEGFTATLAFYISESNKAQMNFHDFGKQMQEIVKKLKPTNCWEENFGIQDQPEQVLINGKRFTEYKLYRATYYPLNKEPVRFLALPLTMLKYKVAKNPSFFGQNMQQDFKTFYTKPKIINVKDLPPHPLKDQVAVGNFKLEEQFSTKRIATGKSFNYQFKIIGDGNTASVKEPIQNESKIFEVYPPNVFQNINRSGTAVLGTKNYNYFVVPKEPGKYKLGDYIFWVYFNTKTAKYDTLKSKIEINVKGESTVNKAVASNDYSGFLDLISTYGNKISNQDSTKYIKLLANIFLLFIFIVTLIISIKK